MVNTKIDPFNPKLVPYLRNKQKTFWAFSSTSPLTSTALGFLGDNGYHEEKKLKSGTFFSLYGKIWGYDITIFNIYNEKEESIDKYMDIFTDFLDNPPSLNEALIQVFIAGGVPENELNDYFVHLNKKINKLVEDRDFKIKEKYPHLSQKIL